MRIVSTPSDGLEIESPIFRGSITLDAAEEMAHSLLRLVYRAKDLERFPDLKKDGEVVACD